MDWNTPVYSDVITGGSGDYSSSSPQPTVEETNTVTSNSARKCPHCNGSGKRLYDDYQASNFGLDIKKEKCEECNSWYPANQTHNHISCGYCHGTGIMK